MIKNFFEMHSLLKFIVCAGFMAPIAVFFSILEVKNRQLSNPNMLGIGFLFICTSLIFVSSILFCKKMASSRSVWIVGWVFLSFSPYFLNVVKDGEVFFTHVFPNLIVGLFVAGYLFKSKPVNSYLEK